MEPAERSTAREGSQPCQVSLQRGTERLRAASKKGRGMLHFIGQLQTGIYTFLPKITKHSAPIPDVRVPSASMW